MSDKGSDVPRPAPADVQLDEADSEWLDECDGVVGRPQAYTRTLADAESYNMDHRSRGLCVIFSFDKFHENKHPPRNYSASDASRCETTFKNLGFDVQVKQNLKKDEVKKVLREVSGADHSNNDALVVVYTSHGGKDAGREVLYTFDDEMPTKKLWEPFLGNKCPSLAGKPKLFFIQACQGEKADKGLKVSTDSNVKTTQNKDERPPDYVVPAHADLLVMWGPFEEHVSPPTNQLGINGSVFLHFLCNTIDEERAKAHLYEILFKVTRKVAIAFEASKTGNKQVPHFTSTLLRKVYFTNKGS